MLMETKDANPDLPDRTSLAQLDRKHTAMQSIMDIQSKQTQLCHVAVGEPMGKWGILFIGLLSSTSIMFDAAPLGAGVEHVI